MYVNEGKEFFSLDPMGIELSFNESKRLKIGNQPKSRVGYVILVELVIVG